MSRGEGGWRNEVTVVKRFRVIGAQEENNFPSERGTLIVRANTYRLIPHYDVETIGKLLSAASAR